MSTNRARARAAAAAKRAATVADAIRAAQDFGFTLKEVGEILGASWRSVHRWARGTHRPHRRHMDRAEGFLAAAYAIFCYEVNGERIAHWLHQGHIELQNRTPAALLRAGAFPELIAHIHRVAARRKARTGHATLF